MEQNFRYQSKFPSTITSQFLYFNKHIKIDGKYIYFEELSKDALNFVGNLSEKSGNIKPWVKIKEHYLLKPRKFQWMQLTNALYIS